MGRGWPQECFVNPFRDLGFYPGGILGSEQANNVRCFHVTLTTLREGGGRQAGSLSIVAVDMDLGVRSDQMV